MTAMKGKSGNSGDWETGSNWSSGSVAGIGDDATIAAAGPVTEAATTPWAGTAEAVGRMAMPLHPLVTSDSWTNTAGGDWGTGSNWSTGSAPTSSVAATIAAAGTYTVTITAPEAAQSLSVTDSGVTVSDTSTLSIGSTLSLAAGDFDLASGGDVVGGTITVASGSSFSATAGRGAAGGTLSGVSYSGTLDLSSDWTTLTVTNGINFSASTINFTAGEDAQNSYLNIAGTTTINNVAIDIGHNTFGGGVNVLENLDTAGTGAVLTLGSKVVINHVSGVVGFYSSDDAGDGIVNQGTINADASGGLFSIDATNFTNSGTINVANGDVLRLTGPISAVLINGIKNTDGLIDIAGTVQGGTISSTGGGIGSVSYNGDGSIDRSLSSGGTLSGVSFQGTLNLSADWSALTITNGISFAGTGGTGSASVNFAAGGDAQNSYLNIAGTTTINNVAIDIGHNTFGGGVNVLENLDTAGTGAVLTLGSKVVINHVSGVVGFYSSDDAGDGIVNQGTINADASGGLFSIDATNFTNSGTINVANGDVLRLTGPISAVLINSIKNTSGLIDIAGTVSGGTITSTGGGIGSVSYNGDGSIDRSLSSGGTLSSVSLQGTLNLSADWSALTIAGSFTGASGTGSATIDLTCNSPGNNDLYVAGTSTLNNVAINIGNDGYGSNINNPYAYIVNEDTAGTGAILTLGAGLTINQAGDQAGLISTGNSNDGIVNDGTIDAAYSGGFFEIDATDFTNNGTVIAGNDDTLYLTGAISAALIDGIKTSGGGIVWIDGDVTGGTITAGSSNIGGAGGTLTGVSFEGTLDLEPNGSQITIAGTTTFSGVNGSGVGTINFFNSYNPQNFYLYIDGSETLNNVIINIGDGASGNNTNGTTNDLVNNDTNSQGATLVIGSSATINLAGLGAALTSTNFVGDGIVNNGIINAGYTGGTLIISSATFTNTGSITAANGGVVSFQDSNLTNLSAGTLTGGSYAAYAGSAIAFGDNSLIASDQSNITLSGANSSITSGGAVLDSSLGIIAATGTLSLLSGREFAATANGGTFTDSGLLSLGAGTLTAGTLTVTPGGKLLGNGSVQAAVSNAGSIEANGGTLLIGGSLTGTGGVQIDAAAALEAGGSVAATETLTFGGSAAVLKIDAAASFAGSLANFAGGDIIDFANTTLTHVSTSGTSLLAVSAAGTTTLTLAAPLASLHLALGTDGNGGTDITAYNLASASNHSPEPVAFGNRHVGATVSTALTLSNTAPTGGFSERLDAKFSGTSGAASASGTIFRLAAGLSNSTSLVIGLNTATAGAVSGTATLALTSDGGGVDGFGDTSIGSQVVNVTGDVYAYAAGSQSNAGTLVLANSHVGQAASGFVTLSNSAATGGYSEALDAGLSGASSGFTTSGTLTGLAAGATSNGALKVGFTDANAGTYSGTALLNLVSDGTGIDGLGTTSLGSQTVTIKGTAYAYAKGVAANGGIVALASTHVGQAASGFVTLTNGAVANTYSEALDATLTTSAAGFSAGGAVLGLAAGLSNSTSLHVGHTASAAGAYSGTATLGLVSDGNGIDGLGATTLTSQSVTVTGAAYAYAVGDVASETINLGVVHTSSSATATLGLSNGAAVGNYSEALDAGWGTASSGVLVSGSATRVAAGASTSALSIGLSTSSSGSYSGTAVLDLTSDGTGIDGLGTTTLTAQTITVSGIVDNYAVAAFEDGSSDPAITGSGTAYAINLGTLVQGGVAQGVSLGALNAATGLADLLQGTLSTAGGAGFTNSGFGTFAGLAAGQGELSQGVTLTTGTAGVFSETLLLSSAGTNASGYDGALATETLTVTGTVVTPGSSNTYTLAAGPNTVLGAAGGDLFIAPSGAVNSRDSITGGSGSNTLQLTGGGSFDLDAPKVLAGIETIIAAEGQAGVSGGADGRQTVYVRDGVNQTVDVTSGTAAHGNANPETITLYDGDGNNAYALGAGTDTLYLSTGNDTVVLGGARNSVVAGGGSALVQGTAAVADASVVGTTSGSTTLQITNAGTVALNAADTYVTVQLTAATRLTLDKLAFITADGSNGGDTIAAGAANQTLIGGAADVLTGYTGGGDLFSGASAALSGDTIHYWTTGDTIDLTDMSPSATVTYSGTASSGKLTVSDGTHRSVITFVGDYTGANFAAPVSDGHGGALIDYHS